MVPFAKAAIIGVVVRDVPTIVEFPGGAVMSR